MQTSSASAAALMVGASNRVFGANDRIRLAQIGLGGRGTSDLKSYARIKDFEIVSLCDLIQEKVDRGIVVAKEDGHKPEGFQDFRKMLDKGNLDAVVVCTEVGNHAKCVVPVLEANLHCFSEKPMDCTVEKVDAIVKAARKSKGIYQVGFQRRYNPTFLKTIAEAQSDRFGNITFLQGHWYFPGQPGGWVMDVDMSGGKLVEQACHHMDVMTWVMGTHPAKCSAMGAITVEYKPTPRYPQLPPHLAEDHSSLSFQFPNGVILSYTHFSCMPPDLCMAKMEKLGEGAGEKLWAFKDQGLVDLAQGTLHPRKGDPERVAEATDYYNGSFQQFEQFAQHIRKNEKPNSNVETARLATLTALMGHQAMYNREKRKYEPGTIEWKDLGSTTE